MTSARQIRRISHYKCFLGDVVFLVNTVDLSARWGWIPVLDFAVALRAITLSAPKSGRETFEFTEPDDTITFTHHEGEVQIEASYVESLVMVAHAELDHEAIAFLARLLGDLTNSHPELVNNRLVRTMRAEMTP